MRRAFAVSDARRWVGPFGLPFLEPGGLRGAAVVQCQLQRVAAGPKVGIAGVVVEDELVVRRIVPERGASGGPGLRAEQIFEGIGDSRPRTCPVHGRAVEVIDHLLVLGRRAAVESEVATIGRGDRPCSYRRQSADENRWRPRATSRAA